MLDEIPSGIYALDKLKISLSPLSLYATQLLQHLQQLYPWSLLAYHIMYARCPVLNKHFAEVPEPHSHHVFPVKASRFVQDGPHG
jgi:hypothetical protein